MDKATAETKWCRMARADATPVEAPWSGSGRDTSGSGSNIEVVGINRGTALNRCKCITTKCMAWIEHGNNDGFCVLGDDNRNI